MRRRTLVPSEHEEQAALMQQVKLYYGRFPELELLYAVPNGARTSMSVAKRLKAEGMKSGVPDIVLPVPRGIWHGLYIELKRRKNGTLSEPQKWWLMQLQKQGYFAVVCVGWEKAWAVITEYLELRGNVQC